MSSDRPQGITQPASTMDTEGVMGGVYWVSINSYQFLNQLNSHTAVYWIHHIDTHKWLHKDNPIYTYLETKLLYVCTHAKPTI